MISIGQTGSLASELFGDFIEDLFDKYQQEKKTIKEIFKENKFLLTPEITKEQFMEALNSFDLIGKIKEKDVENEKIKGKKH